MLWRVRTTMPDRPGALATLAQGCGDAGVNILAMQVFPGVESVTDDFLLEVPVGWNAADLASLVERAGARAVVSHPCTEQALVDQPSRYVEAARCILAQPARFPEVVAGLFDADAGARELPGVADSMVMSVREVSVQIRREVPFTATEHARGAAMAGLVSEVLERAKGAPSGPAPGGPGGVAVTPDYVTLTHEVRAEVGDGRRTGSAGRARHTGVPALGAGRGPCVVLGSGLRGRIRMSGDELSVRVPLRDLETARP